MPCYRKPSDAEAAEMQRRFDEARANRSSRRLALWSRRLLSISVVAIVRLSPRSDKSMPSPEQEPSQITDQRLRWRDQRSQYHPDGKKEPQRESTQRQNLCPPLIPGHFGECG